MKAMQNIQHDIVDQWVEQAKKSGGYLMVSTKVGPNLAKRLLKRNAHNNRPVARDNFQRIKRDMERGEFRGMASDPLRINRQGILDNGQHRLEAIVVTGKAIELPFIIGGHEDDGMYYDMGRRRTGSDAMRFAGHETAGPQLTTVLKFVNDFDNGTLTSKRYISNQEYPIIYQLYPDIEESVRFRNGWHGLTYPNVAAGMHYIFRRASSKVMADRFMDQLRSGDNLGKTSVLFKLRKRLIEEKGNFKHEGGRKGRVEHAIWMINAWNAMRKGSRKMDFSTDGGIPDVIGL